MLSQANGWTWAPTHAIDIILEDGFHYRNLLQNFRELATEFIGWVSLYTQAISVTPTAPVSHFDPRLLIFLLPILKHPNLFQHWLKIAKRGPNFSVKVPWTGETVALERMSTFGKMHITTPISFIFLNSWYIYVITDFFFFKGSCKPHNLLW